MEGEKRGQGEGERREWRKREVESKRIKDSFRLKFFTIETESLL